MIRPLWQRIGGCILLSLFAALFLLPLCWVVLTSIKPTKEIYDAQNFRILPSQVTLDHYRHVVVKMSDFPRYCWNTARVTVVTIAVVLLGSSMCGYALARLRFFGGKSFLTFLLIIMAVPWVVMLIPIYRLEVAIGLLNSLPGLILPYAALFMPMAILIMRAAFLAVPSDLREAAMIDGASEWRVWFGVMLPLVRPSLTVVALMTFLSCWKEFTYAVTLNSLPSATTLAVGITYLQEEGQSWAYGTLCAAIVLSVLPLLIAFVAFQRQIVGGLTEGALKG